MTTNSTIPAPSTHRPRKTSRWFPRSATAWTVLVLSTIAIWTPAFFVAAAGYLIYPGCFDTCGDRSDAYAHYAVAAAVALTPVVALRIHQGEQSAPPAGRALATIGFVAAVAAATWWLWASGW
jgi:hypothetical protein